MPPERVKTALERASKVVRFGRKPTELFELFQDDLGRDSFF